MPPAPFMSSSLPVSLHRLADLLAGPMGLLEQRVILPVNLFIAPKPKIVKCPILDLKALKVFIQSQKFFMESTNLSSITGAFIKVLTLVLALLDFQGIPIVECLDDFLLSEQ